MTKKIYRLINKHMREFKRRSIRAYKHIVFKSNQSKTVRKCARMDAHKAIKLMARFVYFNASIRPRIKLITVAIIGLIMAFFVSNQMSGYIKSNEAEIKVNGHAVLVADKATETVEQTEIEAAVTYKRSPFDFKYPVDGQISQGFRSYHRAFDIAAPYNSPIKPLGNGRVEFAGRVSDGKGNLVIIDHGDGLKTSYAHMNKIVVGVGDEVTGEIEIGTIGLTGHTTGPHVHLEVYDNGITISPGDVLPDR